jgi:hypothetical protein
MLPRKAKGRRPVYSGPDTDKLYAMVMALAAETSVLRERIDTIERVLAAKGVISRGDIEAHVLDAAALEERELWRSRFLARLFRVINDEVQAEAAGESTDASAATVREIEGR